MPKHGNPTNQAFTTAAHQKKSTMTLIWSVLALWDGELRTHGVLSGENMGISDWLWEILVVFVKNLDLGSECDGVIV